MSWEPNHLPAFRLHWIYNDTAVKSKVVILSRIYKLARVLLTNFWKIQRPTSFRIVLLLFWVTKTCKIYPHLIRLRFETRKEEDTNAFKFGVSTFSIKHWHSFLKYYYRSHIVLKPWKKSKEEREEFTHHQ